MILDYFECEEKWAYGKLCDVRFDNHNRYGLFKFNSIPLKINNIYDDDDDDGYYYHCYCYCYYFYWQCDIVHSTHTSCGFASRSEYHRIDIRQLVLLFATFKCRDFFSALALANLQ